MEISKYTRVIVGCKKDRASETNHRSGNGALYGVLHPWSGIYLIQYITSPLGTQAFQGNVFCYFFVYQLLSAHRGSNWMQKAIKRVKSTSASKPLCLFGKLTEGVEECARTKKETKPKEIWRAAERIKRLPGMDGAFSCHIAHCCLK